MANAKKLTYAQVYDTLSKVNVNEFTEEKMGLTYLSWSQAVRIFTEHFPEWSLKWHGTTDANDVLLQRVKALGLEPPPKHSVATSSPPLFGGAR